jgi:hypothetical protein
MTLSEKRLLLVTLTLTAMVVLGSTVWVTFRVWWLLAGSEAGMSDLVRSVSEKHEIAIEHGEWSQHLLTAQMPTGLPVLRLSSGLACVLIACALLIVLRIQHH